MNRKYSVTYRKEGEERKGSWLLLGTFFLGPIWLLICGMWGPALLYTAVAILTSLLCLAFPPLFLVLLALPFLTGWMVRRFYLENGWEEVVNGKPVTRGGQKATTALEQAQIDLLKAQTEAIRRDGKKKATSSDDVPTYKI